MSMRSLSRSFHTGKTSFVQNLPRQPSSEICYECTAFTMAEAVSSNDITIDNFIFSWQNVSNGQPSLVVRVVAQHQKPSG